MSIQITALVLELQRQVEAQARELEALKRIVNEGPRRYAVLYTQAKAMKAKGEALKAEVRAILDAHTGPKRLKAYAVLTMLKRNPPPPSLRRVQEIIRELRAESAGPR